MPQAIKVINNIVTINSSGNDYSFKLNDLEKIRTVENPLGLKSPNYSEIISQLVDKSWIENETLYELAKLTVAHYPDNNIDWHETFMLVERHFYHKALNKHEDLKNPKQSLSESVLERIKRGRDERAKNEIENGLEFVVKENLKKYGICDL